jgi:hypothetical protein
MGPLRALPAVFVVAGALLAPAAGEEPAKPKPAPREAIEALETRLARAADQASLPHAALLLGRTVSARGYRIPGYGVVFVLTPRALPGEEGRVYVLRGGSPPKVRRFRVEARHPAPPDVPDAPEAPEDHEVAALERQVLVLQHETEEVRRAAEEEMDRLMEHVRVRVTSPSEVHVEVVTPADAPAPPPPPPVPMKPETPRAPEAPPPPPAPPWKYWFETGAPQDERDPAKVVADVRAALVDALADQGSRLDGLAGEERVTVTVDFVGGGVFAAQARPEKTLVLSARVRDLAARARGAIGADEFRKRVEATEY